MPNQNPDCLTPSELERYERQIILPEIGADGQARLASGSVLVVGAGGLGSPALLYLAAAGVGRIGIADSDRVALGNLHRQVIHATSSIGQPKTESAHRRLTALNPGIRVETYPLRFTGTEAERIVEPYTLVVDATDNLETRLLINRICLGMRKTMIFGSAQGWEGQAGVFDAKRGPCYECLLPAGSRSEPPAVTGVIGPLPGIIGALEALEAIQQLLGAGDSSIGRLLAFDGLRMEWNTITVPKNPHCPACGSLP